MELELFYNHLLGNILFIEKFQPETFIIINKNRPSPEEEVLLIYLLFKRSLL